MAVVICDISAIEYWQTPPLLGEVEIPPERALLPAPAGAGIPLRQLQRQRNARTPDILIANRLLTDLKGISTPVHVMTDHCGSMRPNALTVPRKLSGGFPRELLVDIGNGLSVLTPEAALCCMPPSTAIPSIAELMYEACGIYALAPSNRRIDLVTRELTEQGLIAKEAFCSDGIYGYSDEAGRKIGHVNEEGEDLSWTPAFDRQDKLTNMWKRPSLTTCELIRETLDVLRPHRRCLAARRALSLAKDGSASPAETKAALLLFSGYRYGGESWGSPDLNRRIYFDTSSSKLTTSSFCIADILWADRKKVLEIQSETYHADKLGYKQHTGKTAALESMGYTVAELSYDQMSDLEKLDIVLGTLSKKLDFPLQRRTSAFLAKRKALHKLLFH